MGSALHNKAKRDTDAQQPPPSSPLLPSRPQQRHVTLDVFLLAAQQFVAFACGSLVPRTRPQSPARLLAQSPSAVAELGRNWVLGPCRDVAFTLRGGIKGGSLEDEHYDVHVWMRLSPTLGVVRFGQFPTFGAALAATQMAGCIGEQATAARIQPPAEEGEGVSGKKIGRDRLVVTRTLANGVMVDIVDGSGVMVRNVFTCTPSWINTSVCCNSRWIVIANTIEITLLRLCDSEVNPSAEGESCKPLLFTPEDLATISWDNSTILSVSLCDRDADVLLMAVPKSPDNFNEILLQSIDLVATFTQRSLVLQRGPVTLPLPRNEHTTVFGGDPICVCVPQQGSTNRVHLLHNTVTNQTHTIDGFVEPLSSNLLSVASPTISYSVFHTSDLTTPCARGYRHKQVPGSTDGSTMWITMVLECGIFVWECGPPSERERLKRTSVRYPVTDAETDTLLAAITYNAPGRPRQLSDPDEFDLTLELS